MTLALLLGGPEAAYPAEATDHAQLRAFLQHTIQSSTSFGDRFDAEVWLTDMQTRLARFMQDPHARLTFLRQVHAHAVQSGLPPELVLAVIQVESGFDRYAVSRVGAQGYMQVMPFWKREIGRPQDNLIDAQTNLSYGCRILEYYLKRENGDLHRALAAYNGSSGSPRYSSKVRRVWNKYWRTQPLDW